jgi:hypothetical protein
MGGRETFDPPRRKSGSFFNAGNQKGKNQLA